MRYRSSIAGLDGMGGLRGHVRVQDARPRPGDTSDGGGTGSSRTCVTEWSGASGRRRRQNEIDGR